MFRFYIRRTIPISERQRIAEFLSRVHLQTNTKCTSEWCYYVDGQIPLSLRENKIFQSLFASYESDSICTQSFLPQERALEIGPRLAFETAWSSAVIAILQTCGMEHIQRIEHSRRYAFTERLTYQQECTFIELFSDPMTEERYPAPLRTFEPRVQTKKSVIISLTENDYTDVLNELSKNAGLSFDSHDIEYIGNLFVRVLQRNPTNVELFQLAQANSEHSRHWLFKGTIVIDGTTMDETLMEIVQTPWKRNKANSLIAFSDDSSALHGKKVGTLIQRFHDKSSPFIPTHRIFHPTLTAETHNFPTGVAPYPGAATGTGGRIRDNQAVGRGGLVIAGAAAYCVGNLNIPRYNLPWENDGWQNPENLASPLSILIEASNGASDYGNCFGEPVIAGFVRTGGITQGDTYRSWFKPIMYTAGIGQIDEAHLEAHRLLPNMLVVLLGGPSYRIGIGGGSASSRTADTKRKELDFDAVQRGNPEMEQRLNRVIRACSEMGENNLFKKLVDLGAGGASNALTELLHPLGGKINLDAFPCGDKTLSVLELWINESQERIAAVIHASTYNTLAAICARERVPLAVAGTLANTGEITVTHTSEKDPVVNLPLPNILGTLPKKTFCYQSRKNDRVSLAFPVDLSLHEALSRVLHLPSVGSKRFLTTKVDRSVTGLVARQQCVGPNHLPLSDFGIVAQSHFTRSGIALSIGEQPMKGLISPSAAARMAVAEMILNIAGARIASLESIKCSANWMLHAKGEESDGAWLYEADCALRDICIALGIAIDGGKDSLSMASLACNPEGKEDAVSAPPQLVIAGYAPVPDIKKHITPDIQNKGSHLILIDPSGGQCRLGGSALAQVFSQIGDTCPDIENPRALAQTFEIAQVLAEKGLILSMHDRSDGGLIVAALEMAFSGNTGLTLHLSGENDPLAALFSEEAGLIIETTSIESVEDAINALDIKPDLRVIGNIPETPDIRIYWNDQIYFSERMPTLRTIWEETSAAIDALQANPGCVREEQSAITRLLTPPPYRITFTPATTPRLPLRRKTKPAVAIVREEGSNGDREMASAFYSAGFAPFDVTMSDLLTKKVSLAGFRGIAFVGGFSFADVPQAGVGWAQIITWNPFLKEQFEKFFERDDTFSLGICNGCQLMAHMGWIGEKPLWGNRDFRFVKNTSGRFESRFSTVRIQKSPSIFFAGMDDSILGIWVAHGEGKIEAKRDKTLARLVRKNLVPLSYVDDRGESTERYPFNPNGSAYGIAAVCSHDGRHLAMMPHPERSFITWQWPWMPPSWKTMSASPWMRFFKNAYTWCTR